VNSISEWVLNALIGNIKLTGCSKRKLRKHKAALRKVVDKREPLSSKKKLIIQGGGLVWPPLSAVFPRSLVSFSDRLINTSEKNYVT